MAAQDSALIIMALTAHGALGAALGALSSARATKKSAQAQLYTRLMEEYGENEMSEALRILSRVQRHREWQEWQELEKLLTQKETLIQEEAFTQEDVQDFAVLKDTEKAKFFDLLQDKEVDWARRHVKYYFLKILRLNDKGYLPRKLLKTLSLVDGIDVFFDIVQPLENLRNENFDNSEFEKLRKRVTDRGTKEVMKKPIGALQKTFTSKTRKETPPEPKD